MDKLVVSIDHYTILLFVLGCFSHWTINEMAIGDCVLAKISKNDDQFVDDNDINVDNQKYF